MPDRFANGDPANDDPAKSPGLFNRSKSRHYHGGDLRGVIQRLPYLKELGVTTLWINPWYDNNDGLNEKEKYTPENKLDLIRGEAITDYHGYGAIDFYGVEERLGDLAILRELVDTAHALGLKVVQDQVANHVGPYHPWVSDPPTPTWFHGTATHHPENTWQTWTIPGADTTGLQLALTFILTSRGIPLIYYGDELALPGGGDPDNRRDFPGGFPGDPRNAFNDSGRLPAEATVWNRVRQVAQLRQRSEALKRGRLVHLDVQEYTYAFARIHGTERLLIVFNSSLQPQTLTIPVRSAGWSDGQTLKDQLGSGLTSTVNAGRVQLSLPARTAVILQ